MSLLVVTILAAVPLLTAYFTYGRLLSRLVGLRPDVATPAVELRDDVDYVPIESKFLLSQHFSAIAAAGPIVGPILAGVQYGWLPALLWILLGSIFIGGVHDFMSLVASVRHKARSIAEVVRDHMSRRSYLLFLSFVWVALVYIIVAFTDVTSSSFLGQQDLGNGEVVTGGGIATSSLLYLALPMLMGLLLRFTKLSVGWATIIFLPLVALSIWGGQKIPFKMENVISGRNVAAEVAALRPEIQRQLTDSQRDQWDRAPALRDNLRLLDPAQQTALKLTAAQRTAIEERLQPLAAEIRRGQKIWNITLVLYCVVASVLPMWLLLQPRGHLGGYFLYFALAAGGIGVAFGGKTAEYPMFRGFQVPGAGGSTLTLFPLLFITIACGACSGFHSIIASGTTSKQLRREPDARPIGYGAMLLEAMVAVISLCCVMMLRADSELVTGTVRPDYLYARGIGTCTQVISNLLAKIGLSGISIPYGVGVSFGLMAFTTFVYDTLDVCTRLGRYILQELTGLTNRTGQWVATGLTAGVPLAFLIWQPGAPQGKPAWMIFWSLFGASNQLLAALTLLGVTVWLWRTYRKPWVLVVTGLPCAFMYTMSMWALCLEIRPLGFRWGILSPPGGVIPPSAANLSNPVPWVAALLALLGGLLLLEAVGILVRSWGNPPASSPSLPVAAAP